ncbi:hypothetical protein AB0H47_14835 [Streptomyces globisporus]|uniref:hypothetical protein n=1 Tax=Streptomyces globisporus TaxID=1908 RepID=UPI003460B0E7
MEQQQTFTEQAGVTYATVGKGKRVHYSPRNDETLCGRVITEYLDVSAAAALFGKGHELCVPCHRAAENRAEGRRLADASPLAAAVVDLVDTIEQADAEQAAEERSERRQHLADSRGMNAYELAVGNVRRVVHELSQGSALCVRVVEGGPETILARDDLHAVAYSGHTTADAVARVRDAVAAHIRHGERAVHEMFPALGMRPALYLPDVMALLRRWEDTQAAAEQAAAEFAAVARAVDAVEHAEQVEAGAATVEDAEAVYAAALVTEAEATAGTWRGAWIGEQDDDALFAIERATEQGALFTDRATVEQAVVEVEQAVVEQAAAECLHHVATRPDVSGDPVKACARKQPNQEAGVFSDEGCVEAYDCAVQAANRAAEWNAEDDDSTPADPAYMWDLLCPDHGTEQSVDECDACAAEEAAEQAAVDVVEQPAVEATPRCILHGAECDDDPKRRHQFEPTAEQVEAAREAKRQAKAKTAARIAELDDVLAVIEQAERVDGTWRGEWIAAAPADAELLDLPADAEQGALFA